MIAQGWTEEKVAQLRTLWVNHSASECAAKLNVTRNAVVGKVHRLGLSAEMPAVAREQRKAERTPSRARVCAPRNSPARSIDVVQMRRDRARKIAAPASAVAPKRVAFEDIGPRACRWIINDDMRAPLYCGHDAVLGAYWCASHYCIVYVPVTARVAARAAA